MPKGFKTNLESEFWAPRPCIFAVLQDSAGGQIFNVFLMDQKVTNIRKKRSTRPA